LFIYHKIQAEVVNHLCTNDPRGKVIFRSVAAEVVEINSFKGLCFCNCKR